MKVGPVVILALFTFNVVHPQSQQRQTSGSSGIRSSTPGCNDKALHGFLPLHPDTPFMSWVFDLVDQALLRHGLMVKPRDAAL